MAGLSGQFRKTAQYQGRPDAKNPEVNVVTRAALADKAKVKTKTNTPEFAPMREARSVIVKDAEKKDTNSTRVSSRKPKKKGSVRPPRTRKVLAK